MWCSSAATPADALVGQFGAVGAPDVVLAEEKFDFEEAGLFMCPRIEPDRGRARCASPR